MNVDLASLTRARIPFALSYPNSFKGASNWFVPNIPCMEGWIEASGLALVSIKDGIGCAHPLEASECSA